MATEKHTMHGVEPNHPLRRQSGEIHRKAGSPAFQPHPPPGETSAEKATGILDTQTYLIYPPVSELRTFLTPHNFVEIQKDGTALPALHVATKLLWSSAKQYSLKDGSVVVGAGRWADLSGWLLPSKDELYSFASANGNRTGKAYRLLAAENPSAYCWLTIQGRTDTDSGCWGISLPGYIFACHPLFKKCVRH
jgi:hypothetical protein